MVAIEWASPAFKVLETMPQRLAFQIVRRTDLLAEFPEQGAILPNNSYLDQPFRKLIHGATYRVVYWYNATQNRVIIVALQHCSQNIPAVRELRLRLQE
jgi:plasmid stabilization system protein ParE